MPPPALGQQVRALKAVVRPGLAVSQGRRVHVQQRQGVSSVTAAPGSAPAALAAEVDRCYNSLDLQFENGKEAFKVSAAFLLNSGLCTTL